MLTMVPIKCPRCQKMTDHLEFWRKVQDKYFHICKDCLNTVITFDEEIMIGFHYGRLEAKEEFMRFIERD